MISAAVPTTPIPPVDARRSVDATARWRARSLCGVTVAAFVAAGIAAALPPQQRNANFRMKHMLNAGWRIARGEGVQNVMAGKYVGYDVGMPLLLAAVMRATFDKEQLAAGPPAEAPWQFTLFHRSVFVLTIVLLTTALALLTRPAVAALVAAVLIASPNWRFVVFSDDVYLFPVFAAALALAVVALLRIHSGRVWWVVIPCLVGIVACQLFRNVAVLCIAVFICAIVWPGAVAPQADRRMVRRRAVGCLGLTLLLSTAATRAIGSAGHVFWHPLHCGLMEFGGHEDGASASYPWFVPQDDIPAGATHITNWSDQRCFSRARKLFPGIRICSDEYDAICKSDFLDLWRRYPGGMIATYLRRAARVACPNPAQRHAADSGIVPHPGDWIAFAALAACVIGACKLRLGRSTWFVVAGLLPAAIAPILVHGGYLMYNLPARLGIYVFMAAVVVEAIRRVTDRRASPRGDSANRFRAAISARDQTA